MKRLNIVFHVVALLVFAAPAHACLQTYHTSLNGKRKVIEQMPVPTTVDHLNIAAQDKSKFWETERKKFASAKDFESRNDYAITLIHLGRATQAIPILEALERERPGVYQTAANLGTAYELTGRNADALKWIREGIKRNKHAHAGTEWVHVAILEAKLAQARDPKWITTHSVLALDFGPNAIPLLPKQLPRGNDGKVVTPKQMRDAIFYQMLERRQFVGPPDPYVADLLFDWANIVAVTATLEEAVDLYNEALRFGVARAPLVKRRIAHMKRVIRSAGT